MRIIRNKINNVTLPTHKKIPQRLNIWEKLISVCIQATMNRPNTP